jgi:hypothetical protein
VRRSLAAGVIQLKPDAYRRNRPNEIDHALHRRFVFAGVKTRAVMGDATFRHHAGRFDQHHAGARKRKLAEVLHVPIGHRPADGAVLTHGRYRDAVRELHPVDRNRRKQTALHVSFSFVPRYFPK